MTEAIRGAAPRVRLERMTLAVGVVALAVAVAVAILVVQALGADGGEAADGNVVSIPTVADLAATSNGGTVAFTWTAPDRIAADMYIYELDVDGRRAVTARTDDHHVTIVDAAPGDEICIRVAIAGAGTPGPMSGSACITP